MEKYYLLKVETADITRINTSSQERIRNRQFERILGLTHFEPKTSGRAKFFLSLAGTVALLTACGTPSPGTENAPTQAAATVQTSTPDLPKVNPVDEALKAEKIDLAGGKVEDYFRPVSKSEAQTNNTPDFPVNPRNNPNLKVGNEVVIGSTGQSFNVLYLDNVENDQAFKATEAGTFRIGNVGGGNTPETKNDTYKLARIEIGDRVGSKAAYLFYIKDARIPENFVWGEKYEVNAGDILFFVVDKNALLPSSLSKGHQIEVLMQGASNPDSPLANFVGSDGKIPFIDESSQGK